MLVALPVHGFEITGIPVKVVSIRVVQLHGVVMHERLVAVGTSHLLIA